MKDVEVSAGQVLGKPGSGFLQITTGFNHERLYVGIAASAIIRHCLETALKYSAQRHAFGKAIIEHQAIQLKIAHLYAQLTMVDAATRELLSLSMDSPEFHLKVSAVKIFASQWTVQACLDTMQILGGMGYSRECDIERFMRDAKLFEIGGGTTDMQYMVIMKGLIKNQNLFNFSYIR
ncbi:MAG: acyl-CoA dehydrogenase [Bdellovibrio sp.]|nr:acyl-CoA dehydrogenase [Bdellovibrio sp.]